MNRTRASRISTAVAAAVLLPFALVACSDSGSDTKAEAPPAAEKTTEADKAPAGDPMTDGQPFGPACAGVPKEGAGSFDGMAKDPVATAASNNPALSTLVAAVKQAGLVDTLNNAQGITVFAPTNDAFAKIPKADLDKVLADKKMLTNILTYHVVGRNVTPGELTNGSFPTLQKGMVTTSGSGRSFKVNGSAEVVCGDVRTSNATVYIVDTVLMPQ